MALWHIDLQPRQDEVPLQLARQPNALPKTLNHEHKFVKLGKQSSAFPLLFHDQFAHDLRENPRGCGKPKLEAVINRMPPSPMETNEGPRARVKTHVVVPRHLVVGYRVVFHQGQINELLKNLKLEGLLSQIPVYIPHIHRQPRLFSPRLRHHP